ncbi:MAG TPA: STAS-like domain-containing protein [Candidatus Binatia bacterium]|nr:STAS-like domain-containing protein [Candidatus Binatia bacterium]
MGSRFRARELREEMEQVLAHADEVVLDFTGMKSATQSFVDELVGVLILKHGPDIVQRLVFKGCAEDIKEIVGFVVSTRTDDFTKKNQH